MNIRYSYKILILKILLLGTAICTVQGRDVINNYGLKISVPDEWIIDSAEARKAKVHLAELLTSIKSDGKVRIMNTGTEYGNSEGYSRARLNITSDVTLSQNEVANLTDPDINDLAKKFGKQLIDTPLIRVDPKSISVMKTRTDDGYFGIRLGYERSGTSGPVKVYQYWFPFSNRAVQLTLSYEVSKQDALWPTLVKILASLRLIDKDLWPKQ